MQSLAVAHKDRLADVGVILDERQTKTGGLEIAMMRAHLHVYDLQPLKPHQRINRRHADGA